MKVFGEHTYKLRSTLEFKRVFEEKAVEAYACTNERLTRYKRCSSRVMKERKICQSLTWVSRFPVMSRVLLHVVRGGMLVIRQFRTSRAPYGVYLVDYGSDTCCLLYLCFIRSARSLSYLLAGNSMRCTLIITDCEFVEVQIYEQRELHPNS